MDVIIILYFENIKFTEENEKIQTVCFFKKETISGIMDGITYYSDIRIKRTKKNEEIPEDKSTKEILLEAFDKNEKRIFGKIEAKNSFLKEYISQKELHILVRNTEYFSKEEVDDLINKAKECQWQYIPTNNFFWMGIKKPE